MVALRVNDPREYEIPDVGFITLEDAETGELIELDARSPKVRALFAQNAKQRDEQINDRLRRSKVDQLKLDTQSDSVDELRKFFDMRERRIRH